MIFATCLQIVSETIPALVALKSAGLVRHIGITGLPIKLYPTVLSRLPPGTLDVCLSYCHYCLNDRSLIGILPQLEKHNVGIINASCLSMGLLTASGPPDWHPAPQELKDAAARAAQVASGKGQDISELALVWAVPVCHLLLTFAQDMNTVDPTAKLYLIRSSRVFAFAVVIMDPCWLAADTHILAVAHLHDSAPSLRYMWMPHSAARQLPKPQLCI